MCLLFKIGQRLQLAPHACNRSPCGWLAPPTGKRHPAPRWGVSSLGTPFRYLPKPVSGFLATKSNHRHLPQAQNTPTHTHTPTSTHQTPGTTGLKRKPCFSQSFVQQDGVAKGHTKWTGRESTGHKSTSRHSLFGTVIFASQARGGP